MGRIQWVTTSIPGSATNFLRSSPVISYTCQSFGQASEELAPNHQVSVICESREARPQSIRLVCDDCQTALSTLHLNRCRNVPFDVEGRYALVILRILALHSGCLWLLFRALRVSGGHRDNE